MESTPEKGMWVAPEHMQTIIENMSMVIREQSQALLLDLAGEKEKKDSEAEDTPAEDSEDNSDHDSDSDDDDNGGGQEGHGQADSQGEDSQEKDDQEGSRKDNREGDQEASGRGEGQEDPQPKGGQQAREEPGQDQNPANQVPAMNLVQAMTAWYQKKDFVINLINKLKKEHEILKKFKSDIEISKTVEESLRRGEQLDGVRSLIKNFFKQWPTAYPHNQAKCQLPPHPSCIQVLETPPMATPTPEMGAGPRGSTYSLTSLAMQLELLLGHRPKYECMQDVRASIQDMRTKIKVVRGKLEQELEEMEADPERSVLENFSKFFMILQDWGTMVREESQFLESCIENLPDSPALLYAIAPPPEALPRFYPVLYPAITEPADADEYVLLVEEFQKWRVQMEDNRKAMREMMQAQEGEIAQLTRDMFDNWAQHQTTLIRLCNNLLQHHIVTSRVPAEKKENLAMEIDVQWMADRLLTARIETNKKAFDSWLATAYWCTQLAKARVSEEPDVLEVQSKGKKQKKKLHMFEQMKPTEICKLIKPSTSTSAFLEQRERDQGEPYDEQGQGSQADLMEILNQAKTPKEAEAARKKARALARWRGQEWTEPEPEGD